MPLIRCHKASAETSRMAPLCVTSKEETMYFCVFSMSVMSCKKLLLLSGAAFTRHVANL